MLAVIRAIDIYGCRCKCRRHTRVHTRVHIVHGIHAAGASDHVAGHASANHTGARHASAAYTVAECMCILHGAIAEAGGHGAAETRQPAAVVLLAHAVDVGPEALFEPADLAEDFFAADHFFFAVAGCRDVCELVDEGACCVDEFGKGGRCPVGDQGLVEGYNVVFIRG